MNSINENGARFNNSARSVFGLMAGLVAALCLPVLTASERSVVRFQADWFTNGQFAGFLVAEEQGHYQDSGIEFQFEPFDFGVDFIGRVSRGESHFGTAESYILLEALAGGEELVLLGAVFETSPAGYIYLESSGIKSPKDLTGKRVGIHKYGEGLLPFFIEQAKIEPSSVESVVVQHDIGILLDEEVDLHQGYAIDEMLILQRRTEDTVGILTFEELGLPMYSMILFTSRKFAETYPETVSKFLSATQLGWSEVVKHSAAAAETVKRAPSSTDQPVSELIEQLEAMKPYLAPSDQILTMERHQLQRMVDVFYQSGLVSESMEVDSVIDPNLSLVR